MRGDVWKPGLRILLLATFVLLMVANPTSMKTGGQIGETTVDVSITPDEGHANMSSDRAVNFTCHITVDTLPLVITNVNVSVEAGIWYNETETENVVLTGDDEEEFDIRVYAPYGSLAGSRQKVNVTLRWSTNLNEEGVIDESVEVVVDQFYRLSIYTPINYRSVHPGESIDITAHVTNSGNGQDTVKVEVTEDEILVQEGWSLEPDPTSISLQADMEETVRVNVDVPAGAEIRQVSFKINVTSKGAEAEGLMESVEKEVKLEVKEETNGGNGGNGTNGGNGGDDGGDDGDDAFCSSEVIPLMVLTPLCVTALGIKRMKGRGGSPGPGHE